MGISREGLVKAAQELNEVMGLVPPINTEEDVSSLRSKILKALEFREEGDEFSPEVEEVFEKLLNNEENEENIEEVEQKEETKKEKKEEEKEEKVEKPRTKVKDLKKKNKEFSKEWKQFVYACIESGRFTKREIVAMTLEKYPVLNKGSIQVLLSDAKNPKYTKFDRLMVENEHGVVSFSSEKLNKGKKGKKQ